jgi:hypothetical protein
MTPNFTAGRKYPVPDWARRGKIRWAWAAWEPLLYYRRVGSAVANREDIAPWLDRIHRRQTLELLAAAGFNCITTHFVKGFGLRHEKREIRRGFELVGWAHECGLRALAYIPLGSISFETFGLEEAAYQNWLCRRPDGTPETFGQQYWRLWPAMGHPGFLEYLGRCIDYALAEGGFDGIWFDHCLPTISYCDFYRYRFHRYLEEHGDELRAAGFTSLELVAPPPVASPGDPVWRLWQDCCHAIWAEAVEWLADRIKSHGAQKLIAANDALVETRCTARVLRLLDLAFCEAGWSDQIGWAPGLYPRRDPAERARVSTQAAFFLAADAHGTQCIGPGYLVGGDDTFYFPGMPDARRAAQTAAEGMFFGGQSACAFWALCPRPEQRASFGLEREDLKQALTGFNTFLAATERLHAPARSAAEVAVFFSRDTMRWRERRAVLNNRAAWLALLRGHIPFRLLPQPEHGGTPFDELGPETRVVVLPDSACLGRAELESLARFVNAGGGALLLHEAAGRNEIGQRAVPERFAEVFGIPKPASGEMVRPGRGRLLWLAEPWVDPAAVADSESLLPQDAAWDVLPQAARDLFDGAPLLSLAAEPTTFCSAYWLEDGTLVIGLLNYAPAAAESGGRLTLSAPACAGRKLTWHAPGATRELSAIAEGQTLRIQFPPLDIYGLLAIR